MPSSSGPNIISDSSIVLNYDIGDVANSYKGEPTTNLSFNNGQTNSEYLAAPIAWVNAGSYTQNDNETDVPKPNILNFNVTPYRIISGRSTAANGSIHFGCAFTYVNASTTYTVSVWYMQNRAGVGQPYLRTNITNYSIGNLAYNGDTNAANWPVNQWIRISATATTPSGENGIYISNYIGTYVGDKIWYFGQQVEQKSHVTPLVAGTRSNTQGLLDISGGGNSIDLSNVSFDSNAQMTFDGTNDYVDITTSLGTLSQYTIEHISYKGSENRMPIAFRGGPVFYQYGDNSWYYTHGGVAGEYYYPKTKTISGWGHWVIVYNGSYVKIYRNGVYEGQQATAGTANWTNGMRIGYWPYGGGYAWNGQIAIVKMYNRALSDSEVINNYTEYKTRFNLS